MTWLRILPSHWPLIWVPLSLNISTVCDAINWQWTLFPSHSFCQINSLWFCPRMKIYGLSTNRKLWHYRRHAHSGSGGNGWFHELVLLPPVKAKKQGLPRLEVLASSFLMHQDQECPCRLWQVLSCLRRRRDNHIYSAINSTSLFSLIGCQRSFRAITYSNDLFLW